MGSTFLLLHGAFHGGWCWQRVVPRLERLGHRAEALDLPCAADPTADADTFMDLWAEAVVARARAAADPVILVGHSRSGLIISEAAERAPDRIARLVYCAAMLVDGGETMAAARARLGAAPTAPVRFRRDGTGTSLIAEPASAAEFIYSGAEAADRERAVARMTPEPIAGFQIAPRLTPRRYGGVPRAAIECRRDAVLPLDLQRRMRESQPCDVIVTLDCDHAPYLSAPEALSAALDGIARLPRTPPPPPTTCAT